MKFLKRVEPEHIIEAGLLRVILHLAAPMLVSAVLQNVQTLIDLFWVGRLGAVAVASVAMAGTVLMLLFPMLMGLGTGTIALVSRAIGSGKNDEASASAGQSLLLALILGGLSGVAGWYASDSLIHLLGAAPDVVQGGGTYLRILLAASFTVYMLFIGNAALQGAGDTHTPMYVMVTANALNIVLDPFFIFGIGPFPRLGIAGAATATAISQAIAASISLCVLLGGKARLHAHWRYWKPNPLLAWRILRIGIPGTGQMLSRSLMSLVLMSIVASCGTAAVAAYGIGLRFHHIILMPAFALGASAATMMGQNLGAGKPARARKAVWLAAMMDMVVMVIAAVFIMLFAPVLMRVFNDNVDVIGIGTRYLRIVSPFYVFAAVGIVLGRGLHGAGDTVAPMIITILCLWGFQVPLAVYLSRALAPPTDGVWWAMAAAFILQAIVTTAWFELGRWKTKTV